MKPGILTIVFGLACLILSVIAGLQSYQVRIETTALETRAQVASNIGDMHAYLVQLQSNMERRGMVRGNAAVLFPSPENDMAAEYRAITALIERATLMKDRDPASVEYNTALDDMRGTLRELELQTKFWYNIRSPVYWLAWVTGVTGVICLIWLWVESGI